MRKIFFLCMLFGALTSYAQSNELRASVEKVKLTRTEEDFKKALKLLGRDAEIIDLKIQIFFNDIQRNSNMVRNVSEYIERSEIKAASLKLLNDEAEALLKLAETFISPLNLAIVNKVESIMKKESDVVREMKIPEYKNTAFNAELNRTDKIRARLYFYYNN